MRRDEWGLVAMLAGAVALFALHRALSSFDLPPMAAFFAMMDREGCFGDKK